jgi:hypothetical protein
MILGGWLMAADSLINSIPIVTSNWVPENALYYVNASDTVQWTSEGNPGGTRYDWQYKYLNSPLPQAPILTPTETYPLFQANPLDLDDFMEAMRIVSERKAMRSRKVESLPEVESSPGPRRIAVEELPD